MGWLHGKILAKEPLKGELLSAGGLVATTIRQGVLAFPRLSPGANT